MGMIKRICLPVLLVFALVIAVLPTPSYCATDQKLQKLIDSTVNTVKPALVRIMVISVEDYQGREVKEQSYGSGVIIDSAGYVVTNHHVAGHAKQIKCTLADKSEIDAQLFGTDPSTDISVIKLLPEKPTKFPAAKFGDSSAARVGDQVMAMGSPLAFSQSVTMGIISNTELIMPDMMGGLTLDGEDVGSLVRWIGHDARIYPGNSGGPLINIKGEIIGINEIQMGLGGAIPGNLVKEVAEQLIKNGKVTRSWLGVVVQPLLKSEKREKGVLIGSVVEDSPAEIAGIKSGDVLLKLDNQKVSVRFREELPIFMQFASSLKIGKEIDAVVLRDNKEIELKITPVERQSAMARPKEFKEWGLCASNITYFMAKERKRSQNGALVTSVRNGGPAENAKPGIMADDVIVRVAGKDVNDISDLRKITGEIVEGKDDPVPTVVEYDRKTDHYITVVNVGLQELSDSGLEVKKAWVPINTQVLTRDLAKALNIPDKTGVRVVQVYQYGDKPIDLIVGDVVYAINDTPIAASEPEDVEVFPAMIRQYRVGDTVTLAVLRDGQDLQIPVVLQQYPLLPREMKKHRDNYFDLTVRDICFFDRVDQQWPMDQVGVMVESAEQGGWAAVGGLSNGQLILSINNEPTPDVAAFQTVIEKIEADRINSVVFWVKKGIYDSFVEIQPAWTAE